MAFLSYKIPNHKIPKFPNNLWATRISLVGTWICKYKGRSLQIFPTTRDLHGFGNPHGFVGTGPAGTGTGQHIGTRNPLPTRH